MALSEKFSDKTFGSDYWADLYKITEEYRLIEKEYTHERFMKFLFENVPDHKKKFVEFLKQEKLKGDRYGD